MKFGIDFVIKNWHYSTWLVHYLTLQQLERICNAYVKKEGIIFDIGCSTKPYGSLLNMYGHKYFGLEHLSTIHSDHKADVIGTAYCTGLKDNSVDTIFAGALLEHLEEPSLAIKEMYRILKKDGILILTAPLFWHIHEAPRDFFRYTKFGFNYLLEKNSFNTVEIKPLSGFWVSFSEMFLYYIDRFNRWPIKFIPIIPFVKLMLQFAAFILNKIDPKSEIWTWAYIVVGRKKD